MASIATLLVKIAADPTELDKGLKKSERTVEDWGKKLHSAGTTMTKMVTGPIAAMGAGILALQRRTGQYASDISDMAASTGHTTGSVQELNYALGQFGVGQDMVRRLMERNNQRMARAADGNETFAKAYERLGVSIRDANGELRSSQEVFDEVMVGLAGIQNGATRAAVAGQLLGTNAGRRLAGALSGGIESLDEMRQKAHDLGIVMDEDSLKAADDFGTQMDNLQAQIAASGRSIAVDLIPVVQDLLPIIERGIETVVGWIKQFTELNKETQMNRVRILALVAAGGPLLMFLSKAAQGASKLIGLIRVLTAVMMKNPWIAAATGVAFLVERVISANREVANLNKSIEDALAIDATGTVEEYDKVTQALVDVDKKIKDTIAMHESMGVEGTEAAQSQIDALREQESQLVSLRNEIAVKRTQAVAAARDEADAQDDLNEVIGDLLGSRKGLSAQIEENNTKIDALINKTEDLTEAEERELVTLTEANAEIEKIIASRQRLTTVTESAARATRALAEARAALVSAQSDETPGFDDPDLDISMPDFDRMADPDTLAGMNQQLQFMEARLQTLPVHSQEFQNLKNRIADLKLEIEGSTQVTNALMGITNTFTSSFGQGLDNLIVAGERFSDILSNIGKQLASSAIQTAISALLTGGLGGGGFFGIGGGLIGSIFGVNDALITSQGDVVRFHPDDNILAMKDFSALGAGRSQKVQVTVDGAIRGDTIHLANARGGSIFR